MHDRSYVIGTTEYDMRRDLYEKRIQQIQDHNKNPIHSWTMAVNHLTDQTEHELKRLRGLKINPSSKKAAGSVGAHQHGKSLAQTNKIEEKEEASWTHLLAVQQDVNQQDCGSCWAFATAMMMQANAEVKGQIRTFSPQELVDCVPNPHNCGGSGGCDGATVELGMNWITANGLDTELNTPYMAMDSQCKKTRDPSLVQKYTNDMDDMVAEGYHESPQGSPAADFHLQGWTRLPENDYQPLINAIANQGPAAVSVSADKWSPYGGGIFDACGPNAVVDHAVLMIGYGKEKRSGKKFWRKGKKFWHIKNSWSNAWGEGGFIRMLRHEGNVHCGIDSRPKDGTGCDGGPSAVTVCGMCGILYDSVVPTFAQKVY
jgi:cathepsin L